MSRSSAFHILLSRRVVGLFVLGLGCSYLLTRTDSVFAEASRFVYSNGVSVSSGLPASYRLRKSTAPIVQVRLAEDPLSWLEGSVQCDNIKQNVTARYGLTKSSPVPARQFLREEYRHIKQETCENQRFSSCDFYWCLKSENVSNNDLLVALPAKKSPVQDEVRYFAETVLKEEARAALLSKPVMAEPKQEFLPSGASVITAELEKAEQQDEFRNLALSKLEKLAKDRSARQEHVHLAKISSEKQRGLEWLRIAVPGSERMPRVKDSGDSIQSSVSAGNIGRTIVPSMGVGGIADGSARPTYVQPVQAQQSINSQPTVRFVPGIVTQPVDPELEERARTEYQRILAGGAAAQKNVSK